MSDNSLLIEIGEQMLVSIQRIEYRFAKISEASDFVKDENGLMVRDATVTTLINLGECLKNFEKITCEEHIPAIKIALVQIRQELEFSQ